MRWDKRFARHLVPQRAFDRYFVEPRGAVERTRALAPMDAATLATVLVDPPLAEATSDLLRARANAANAAGERDYEAAATAELARVTPWDAIPAQRRSRD